MKLRKVIARNIPDGMEPTEFTKITAAVDESGSVDLADVYDVPAPVDEIETKNQKTIGKFMDRSGISDEKLYAKEYKLRAAHQIIINGGSTAKIAELLNISLGEARNLKNELTARLVAEVRTLDKNKVAGTALMFYDAIQAKFLQMAQVDQHTPDRMLRSKIEALKGALQAQSDKQKFLKDTGFWDEGLRNGQDSGAHADHANDLRDMATVIISGDNFEYDGVEDETKDGLELLN
jgi:hypothetical protein